MSVIPAIDQAANGEGRRFLAEIAMLLLGNTTDLARSHANFYPSEANYP